MMDVPPRPVPRAIARERRGARLLELPVSAGNTFLGS